MAIAANKTITADDIERIVKQNLSGINGSTATATYVAAKMSDMPEVYRGAMPQSDDPKQLSAAEQVLRAKYRADFQAVTNAARQKGHLPAHLYSDQAIARAQAAAGKTPDASTMSVHELAARALAGNPVPDAPAPARPLDYSKMTPQDLILAGLQGKK